MTRLKEEFVSLLKNMYFSLLVWKRWVCEYFFGSILLLALRLNGD